jgi:hypothetical protein
MKNSFATFAKLAAASLALALAGCTTESDSDETQDGGNVVFAQEGKTMALMLDRPAGSAKSGAVTSDTAIDPVTLEKIIVALHYEADCHCYVRTTAFTNTKKGFGRSRTDSIWLYTNGVARSDSFLPRLADSIVHVRHVKRIDGHSGKDVDITARTTLVRRSTDSGTVYVWIGTISGNFKGREIAGSTFSLTRKFNLNLSNGFGVPLGHMYCKRGPHDLDLVFNADGTVTVVVTKNGKHVRTTHIGTDDHES